MADIFSQIGLLDIVKPYDKRIPKKDLFLQGKLPKKDRDLITERIDEIRLSYVLNTYTFPMEVVANDYEQYDCIFFMKVVLRKEVSIQKISRILQETIPSPIIIVYILDEKVLFSSTIKRLNKIEQKKVVMEEFHQSRWINLEAPEVGQVIFLEAISLNSIPALDYKQVYTFIHQEIYKEANFEILEKASMERFYDTKEQTEKYKVMEKRVGYLIKTLNLKSTSLKEKMKLADEIEEIKTKMEKLKNNESEFFE